MSPGFACPHCGRTSAFRFSARSATACRHCGEPVDVASLGSGVPAPALRVSPYRRQICRHIRRTIGEETMVLHEALPNGMPLDIHVVPPQGGAEHRVGRRHFTLVTLGMSTSAMTSQEGHGKRYAELMLALPADWKGLRADGSLDPAAMEQEENWWPIGWLKHIARMPAEIRANVATGDVLPRDHAGKTLSPDTQLTHLMVGPSRLHPRTGALMVHDDVAIEFLALWPLYREEMEFRLRYGAEALLAEFEREGVTELVDVRRAGVLQPERQRV